MAGGFDCYGLLAHVYMAKLGILLPSYVHEYDDTSDAPGTVSLFSSEYARAWRRVDDPDRVPFDVIRADMLGVVHVMIYVGDGEALHVMQGQRACVERVDCPKWKPRIRGYYRHRKGPQQI